MASCRKLFVCCIPLIRESFIVAVGFVVAVVVASMVLVIDDDDGGGAVGCTDE